MIQSTIKHSFYRVLIKDSFTKTSDFYLPVIHHILEDSNLQGHLHGNFESYRNCVHDAWNYLHRKCITGITHTISSAA